MANGPEERTNPEGGGRRPDLADRLWRTLSATVRTVGGTGEDRIRAIMQSVLREETVKAVVQSVVPKEAVSYALRSIDALKDELVSLLARQLHEFLSRIDLGHELQKILTSLSLEVRGEIRFIPNDKAVVRPSVRGSVSVRRVDKGASRGKAAQPAGAAPAVPIHEGREEVAAAEHAAPAAGPSTASGVASGATTTSAGAEEGDGAAPRSSSSGSASEARPPKPRRPRASTGRSRKPRARKPHPAPTEGDAS